MHPQKSWFKKRPDGCPFVKQVGGRIKVSSTVVQCFKNKQINPVFSGENKIDKVNMKCNRNISPVRSRVFVNSSLCHRNVNAMLAKANKVKVLNKMGASIKHKASKTTDHCTAVGDKALVNAPIETENPNNAPRGRGVISLTSEITHNGELSGHTKEMNPASDKVSPDNNEVLDNTQCGQTQSSATSMDAFGVNDYKIPLFDINGFDSDKFANTYSAKQLTLTAHHQAEAECENFNKWKQQSKFDFGFIPLSDFIATSNDHTLNEYMGDPCDLHRIIKQSGTYNFLGMRIPLRTQLNVKEWESNLVDYWDTQLVQLIKFGFPLDFNRDSPLRWEDKNHNSALQFPEHVDAYLKEEISHGAIVGPFESTPINNCHFSPFMTREKSDSDKRRVIIDLSWPSDASVNLGVDKNSYLASNFILTFPTVDDITNALKGVGTGAHLYKVDVSRAFRHVKLDPFDYDLLGLKWRDVTFYDTCLPFGTRHGTQIFQRLSDAVRFIMRRDGYDVINYVDDFVGFGTPSVAGRRLVTCVTFSRVWV